MTERWASSKTRRTVSFSSTRPALRSFLTVWGVAKTYLDRPPEVASLHGIRLAGHDRYLVVLQAEHPLEGLVVLQREGLRRSEHHDLALRELLKPRLGHEHGDHRLSQARSGGRPACWSARPPRLCSAGTPLAGGCSQVARRYSRHRSPRALKSVCRFSQRKANSHIIARRLRGERIEGHRGGPRVLSQPGARFRCVRPGAGQSEGQAHPDVGERPEALGRRSSRSGTNQDTHFRRQERRRGGLPGDSPRLRDQEEDRPSRSQRGCRSGWAWGAAVRRRRRPRSG